MMPAEMVVPPIAELSAPLSISEAKARHRAGVRRHSADPRLVPGGFDFECWRLALRPPVRRWTAPPTRAGSHWLPRRVAPACELDRPTFGPPPPWSDCL